MRYASAKKRVKSNPLRKPIIPMPKTSSVILKILIQNRVKVGKIILKPVGEKTRGIASLPYDIVPPEAKEYFGGNCAARGQIIYRHVTPGGQVSNGIFF